MWLVIRSYHHSEFNCILDSWNRILFIIYALSSFVVNALFILYCLLLL